MTKQNTDDSLILMTFDDYKKLLEMAEIAVGEEYKMAIAELPVVLKNAKAMNPAYAALTAKEDAEADRIESERINASMQRAKRLSKEPVVWYRLAAPGYRYQPLAPLEVNFGTLGDRRKIWLRVKATALSRISHAWIGEYLESELLFENELPEGLSDTVTNPESDHYGLRHKL